MRKIILANIFLYMTVSVYGQEFKVEKITVKEGLSYSRVNSTVQDKFGRIWMATNGGGLNVYSGDDIGNISRQDGLPDDNIKDIEFDSNNNLWIGTTKGLSKFDGVNITTYPFNYFPNDPDNWIIKVFITSTDQIWTTPLGGGIGRLVQNNIKYFNQENGFTNSKVSGILELESGKLLISTNSGELFEYYQGSFTYLESIQKPINVLFKDNENTIWAGSDDLLLNVKERTKTISIPGYSLLSIMRDDSTFWIGTDKGLLNATLSNLETRLTEIPEFSNEEINDLFIDRENQLWVSTFSSGVGIVTKSLFTKLSTESGLSSNVPISMIQSNSDDIWIGYFDYKGIDRIRDNKAKNYRLGTEENSNRIFSMIESAPGNYWVGTEFGLFNMDTAGVKQMFTVQDGLPANKVINVVKGSENEIWIGTSNGVARYFQGQITSIYTGDYIKSFHVYGKDSLLVGSTRGLKMIVNKEVASMPVLNEFDGIEVLTIYNKKEYLWLGTFNHGLIRVDKNWNYKFYKKDTGLASDIIFSITFDEKGAMILGTSRGLNRILFDEHNQISEVEFYGKESGFSSVETNEDAVLVDKEESIWIGTVDGIFKFKSLTERKTYNPNIYFTSVSDFFDEKDISNYTEAETQWFKVPLNPILPYNVNGLVIDFDAVSLSNFDDQYFKYRLLGVNKNWSSPSKVGTARFLNLSPGEYTLQVLTGTETHWSSLPAEYKFTIKQPFWEAWWFIFLTTLFIGVNIYLLLRWRIVARSNKILALDALKQEQYNKLKDEMARDFHDELGNKIAGIIAYSSILEMEGSESHEIVTKIKTISQELYRGTKDFMWSLSSISENVTEMIFYLRDFGEELFSGTNIEFVFVKKNNKEVKNLKLQSAINRQIILVFKEAFTNSLKHSNANKVVFEAQLSDSLSLKFSDNGDGFISDKSKISGLRNMEKRADKIGAELSINSSSKGTNIILKIDRPYYG